MKKQLLTLALIAFSFISTSSNAQTTLKQNRTWVMEFNQKKPNVKIIKFYDDQQKLLYSETFYGRLDISRKQIQQKLNAVLDSLMNGLDTCKRSNILLTMLNKQMNL